MTTRVTLAGAIWPERDGAALLRSLVLVVTGSLLLTLSAKVQVPFWPVPMTMQTFAVVLIGATYGARLGALTVGAYLLQGALGLPVFAAGGGIAYFTGPTAGYLFGFLIAATVVGFLAERGLGRTLPTALLLCLASDLIILSCGVSWLSTLIGFERALAAGVVPFLPGQVLKVALACAVLTVAWRAVRR